MKKRIPSFISGMLTTALFVALSVSALAATGTIKLEVNPISVLVNGEEFHPKDAKGNDVMVFSCNGTTYAPLRALAEAYGLDVGYDSEKGIATVSQPNANSTQEISQQGAHIAITKVFGGQSVDGINYNGKEYYKISPLFYSHFDSETNQANLLFIDGKGVTPNKYAFTGSLKDGTADTLHTLNCDSEFILIYQGQSYLELSYFENEILPLY